MRYMRGHSGVGGGIGRETEGSVNNEEWREDGGRMACIVEFWCEWCERCERMVEMGVVE